MEYAVGKTGRIIAARLFEGEDLYESIHKIAVAENIKSAAVAFGFPETASMESVRVQIQDLKRLTVGKSVRSNGRKSI